MKPVILCIFLTIVALACAGSSKRDFAIDLTTDGFLDDNTFQAIVVGRPDKTAKGLVEQRKTARINATYVMERAVIARLARHICGNEKSQRFTNTVELLNGYLKYGSVFEEVYLIDNSINIVYRFKKSGMRKDLAVIPCGGTPAQQAK